MKGGTVCAKHGGKAPQVLAAAKRRREQERAERAVKVYGLPRIVDPHTALIEELHRTAGHVAWLALRLQDGAEDDLIQQEGGGEFTDSHDRPSVWMSLYQAERANLTRVAKTCHDVGIEERRVRLAEGAGRELANFVRALVRRLGVGDHPQLWEIVREEIGRMTVLDLPSADVGSRAA
jgi:hypothetical protein